MLDSSFEKAFLKFLNMDTQNNQLKGLENLRKTMPNYEVVFGEDTNTQKWVLIEGLEQFNT